MLVFCKCMFVVIAAVQNNNKCCGIYFDQALCALLCLVSCDLGSIAHVCSVLAVSNNNSPFSLIVFNYLAC